MAQRAAATRRKAHRKRIFSLPTVRIPITLRLLAWCRSRGGDKEKTETDTSGIRLRKKIPTGIEMYRKNFITEKPLDTKSIFDDNSMDNIIFPWLTQKYVSESRYGQCDKKDADKLCKAKKIYKFLACFKSTQTSQIFYAIMKEVDKFCNVKIYKSLSITEYIQAHKEVQVLDMVQGCPFFVHILETFKTMGGHYLVTESFGHTTLHNLLLDNNFLADYELKFFACELVTAIEYLHKEGIIHRSLTASNVGVTCEGHIKLFDIENSYMKLEDGEIVKGTTKASGVVSKDAYMSPEMARQEKYTNKVDWWAVGVILYMLSQGKLLNKDPVFRLGDGEVKKHPFFADIDWKKVEDLGYDPPFCSQALHITHMPAELFSSQEFLPKADSMTDMLEDNAKWYKNLARLRSQRPLLYADYELEGDWTRFLNRSHSVTKSMVHVWPYLHVPSNVRDIFDTVEDHILRYPYAEAVNLKIKEHTTKGSHVDFTLFDPKSPSHEEYHTPPETNSRREDSDSRGDDFIDELKTVAHLQTFYETPVNVPYKSRKSLKYSIQLTADNTLDDIDDDPFKYDYDDDDPLVQTVPLGGLLRQRALAVRPTKGKRRVPNLTSLAKLRTPDYDDYVT